jgi:PAS domain S-box-containing protein
MNPSNKAPASSVYKTLKEKISLTNEPVFNYYPGYAKFLLEKKLKEFAIEQFTFLRATHLPLLKYFEHFSEEQLIELSIKASTELLSHCAANKINEYIEIFVEKWMNNRLPGIIKNQVSAEDISLFSFVRRKLFRHFITSYTSDIHLALKILDEADAFIEKVDATSFQALLNIQYKVYKQTQALACIGTWKWDIKTKKLTWSDELYNIYELPPQAPISSQDIAGYNHPEDAEAVSTYIKLSAKTLQPHDFYYRIILRDGRQKVLHAKGEVKQNGKGLPEAMFGTLQDVTNEKQKETQLEESRNFIEKIADVSPCIITVFNTNSNKYIFLNKAVKTLLGYNAEEFLKGGRKLYYSLVHPDDINFIKQKIRELVKEENDDAKINAGRVKEFKYRLKHKDGTYRWLHTFTTVFNRDHNNKVQDVLNISIDITESELLAMQLTAVNDEIKQKERDHQRMINEIEDYAIIMINRDGIIQNWNKGAEKIKGYTANEIIGKSFKIFYRKEDLEKKLPELLIEEALTKGKARHEGWRVRKDGTAFWCNVSITALHDENNNVIGFTKVTRNLTERKIAEDQLREYAERIAKHNEELQKINRDLDSFTYMASHDLQEPLRKIKTFCNFILSREGQNFSKESEVYFGRITAATSRMQKIIESLLYYSRATSAEIVLQPTDLNSLIEEVKKDITDLIAEKNVTIIHDELPVLKVMPLQFQQLFLNIIGNAIKYSRDNVPPVIKITSELFAIDENDETKNFCRIFITDNGIGFEQQYAENIFKLFQRLHGRHEYSGTGVGLAICKKIIENHKGTITAISEPDKGSTFIITVPAD